MKIFFKLKKGLLNCSLDKFYFIMEDNLMKKVIIISMVALLFSCATNSNTVNRNNPNIVYNSTNQGLTISTRDRNVKLHIPSNSLRLVRERHGGGQMNPNYFYFVDKNVNGINVDLHFSGWLLPIENFYFDNVGEFWARGYSQMEFFNHEFRRLDDWEIFLYDVPVPDVFVGVSSSNLRANLLYNDTWIDIRLSITDRNSSKLLHDILFEYLRTVEVILK